MNSSNFISSFSYEQYTWDIDWEIVPSNAKYDRPFETQSIKEQKALEAIASIGVIGSVQLRRLFKLDKSRVKRMVGRKMLVRHELKRNGQVIPVYTIGKAGANKVMPVYIENYWLEWNIEEVLKRLVFFQFCYLFENSNIKIMPSPNPFIGSLKLNKNIFHVYITRGKIDDLMMYLKWKNVSERIIIIAENLNQLKPLEIFLKEVHLKVRVTTDEQLKKESPLFFKYIDNQWIEENR